MICPDCGSEFQPHVAVCRDCGGALITPEERERRLAERARRARAPLEDPVSVREGSAAWLEELLEDLLDAGIPGRVVADDSCRQGCRGPTFRLAVSHRDAARAHARIEARFAERHPEARASQEWMSEGRCPACGAAAAESSECPDCGLALLGGE